MRKRSNHTFDNIRLTNAVEEGLFLALTRAAVPIHRVHIITFLPFGTKTAGGITQKTSTHTHTAELINTETHSELGFVFQKNASFHIYIYRARVTFYLWMRPSPQ